MGKRTTSQFEREVFSGNLSITLTLKISTNFTTMKLTETHRKVGFCVEGSFSKLLSVLRGVLFHRYLIAFID